MNFRVWAEDYMKTADILAKYIEEMKEKRKSLTGEEAVFFDRKIYTLKAMYGDCISTAEILKGKAEHDEESSLW